MWQTRPWQKNESLKHEMTLLFLDIQRTLLEKKQLDASWTEVIVGWYGQLISHLTWGILECDMRAANCQWLWLVTLIDFLVIHMSISPNAFGCSVSEGFMDIDQVQHIIYYMYMCVVRHDQQLSSVTLSMNLSMGLLVHHSFAAIWCFVR